jgi:hypothetical protein
MMLAQAYQLFLSPLPLWDVWYLLIVPLCAGIAIVYKSAKCHGPGDVAKESTLVALWILLAMVGAAIGLMFLSWWMA